MLTLYTIATVTININSNIFYHALPTADQRVLTLLLTNNPGSHKKFFEDHFGARECLHK